MSAVQTVKQECKQVFKGRQRRRLTRLIPALPRLAICCNIQKKVKEKTEKKKHLIIPSSKCYYTFVMKD